ncbi:MAG: hypothetical protein ACLP0J_26410 [Solirubrobacteraceae bacterium]|jgi:hypothetical protein
MSRLIRLDQTGHTTLAQWSVEEPTEFEAAVVAFREELERGYFGIAARADGTAEQITELAFDAPTVILRLPIAGG